MLQSYGWILTLLCLMKPTPNSPWGPAATTPENHQNGNSQAVNRQQADPATVSEGSTRKQGKDNRKNIWVPTGSL